jgi:hypothetical protein
MTKPKKPLPPLLAGQEINLPEGTEEEYWWHGEPGKREASVIKTDRFGQQWVLNVKSTHWVTFRVAAGLLDVTVPTIHSWVKQGLISDMKKRDLGKIAIVKEGGVDVLRPTRAKVSVIPLKEVERIANERGDFISRRLTPKQRRTIKRISIRRLKGGETDAD